MTDDELQAIEARADAATPGPWHLATACCDDDENFSNVEAGHTDIASDVPNADAVFIVAARTDVPALVKEVRRLRQDGVLMTRETAREFIKATILAFSPEAFDYFDTAEGHAQAVERVTTERLALLFGDAPTTRTDSPDKVE
jgi:hypothetical protein